MVGEEGERGVVLSVGRMGIKVPDPDATEYLENPMVSSCLA